MATFIRLARLTEHGNRRIRDFGRVLKEARAVLKDEGVKIVGAYATMGRYDFVVIVEAPDEKAMMRASALVGATGNVTAETLTAVSMDDFDDLFKKR